VNRACARVVEVLALDALARAAVASGDGAEADLLLADADRRMRDASRFLSERDRVDAAAVRLLRT